MTGALVANPNIIGFREIRLVYKRNIFTALLIAIVFHLLLIGTYYIANSYNEDEPIIMIRLRPGDIGPPPRIAPDDIIIPPAFNPTIPTSIPREGIPVPVPDADVNPDATIASQTELNKVESPISKDLEKSGQVVFEGKFDIPEEAEPPDFVPVEKQPMVVNMVAPEYPEIARRAGVEGTVWVKMLVGKDGKVKKAVIQRSDAEVLNENAIKAALQWVFTPAMMNNGPVSVWASVPLRFRINR